ncbi:hypothetical protein [Delftia sp. PS-11]|uniref:hypothetical protein n=1 Tax=Delftia sp. PS-11 TaxID=2767222 RepID=UPI0024568499|nr:hypothetical protein [Delftia sp. PS-11]KAJ8741834.1 hypothetical protein H9T68_20950 [Delftia sp. PS-11]
MSLETRIVAMAQAMGADVKALTLAQGSLSALNTTAKTSLVAAINELVALMGSAGVAIDDQAGNGSTGVTWSADKIFDSIEAAKLALKNELVNGAGTALDTLKELADALGNDPSFATNVATSIASRLRFDEAQVLTNQQKQTARDNIGAAAASDLTALTTAVGNTNRDFVADYVAAKA